MFEKQSPVDHRNSRLTAAALLVLCSALLAAALSGCGEGNDNPAASATPSTSSIRHVFLIVLENKDYQKTFGSNSPAPYLAKNLASRGELLTQYYATGHLSNDNYISMVSGQAPNIENQKDCATYTDFKVSAQDKAAFGQIVGQGCVYPKSVKTIADQLTAAGLTWKGYMEDMGKNASRDGGKTCAHPKIGAKDTAFVAEADDQYATRHNPFVYFHSIIDSPGCKQNDVPLSRLKSDLVENNVPNYAFITPDLCHDAHDAECKNGQPGGLKATNAFLRTWVPRITASKAYQNGGLLIITFDEAEVDDGSDEFAACCNEMPGPNKLLGDQPGIQGPGGGRIGTLLLSPFIKPGTTNDTPFNHYSMLRSVEDIFGLEHLGYARQPALQTFADAGVYNSRSD